MQRKLGLYESYGFLCDCPMCSQSTDTSGSSSIFKGASAGGAIGSAIGEKSNNINNNNSKSSSSGFVNKVKGDMGGADNLGGLPPGIDRKRAFWCPNCRNSDQRTHGIICPIGPLGSLVRQYVNMGIWEYHVNMGICRGYVWTLGRRSLLYTVVVLFHVGWCIRNP